MSVIEILATIFLALIAVLFVLAYVIAPLIAHRKFYACANPQIRRLQPDELEPGAAEFFERMRAPLGRLGFEPSGDYEIPEMLEGQVMTLRAFVNREAQESAGLALLRQWVPGGQALTTKVLGFNTEYEDRRELGVSNTQEPVLYRRGSKTYEEALPGVWDVDSLYEVHRYLMQSVNPALKKWLPGPADELDALRHTLLKSLDTQVEAGAMTLDSHSQLYRVTWKGAFLLTWVQLWPIKPLYVWRMRRRATALMRRAARTRQPA